MADPMLPSSLLHLSRPENQYSAEINKATKSVDDQQKKIKQINQRSITRTDQSINDIYTNQVKELNNIKDEIKSLKTTKSELKKEIKHIHKKTSGIRGFFYSLFKPNAKIKLKKLSEFINSFKEINTNLKSELNTQLDTISSREKNIESNINMLKFDLIKNRFEKVYTSAIAEGLSESEAIMKTQSDPKLQQLKAELRSLETEQAQIIKILGAKRERLISGLMDNLQFKQEFNDMLAQVMNNESTPLQVRLTKYQETLIQICSVYLKQNKGKTIEIETDDMHIVIEAGLKAIRQDSNTHFQKIFDEILNLDKEKAGLDDRSEGHRFTLEAIASAVKNNEV